MIIMWQPGESLHQGQNALKTTPWYEQHPPTCLSDSRACVRQRTSDNCRNLQRQNRLRSLRRCWSSLGMSIACALVMSSMVSASMRADCRTRTWWAVLAC